MTLPDPTTCPVGDAPTGGPLVEVPSLASCALGWPQELGADHPKYAEAESSLVTLDAHDGVQPLAAGAWLGLKQGIQGTGHATTWLAVKLGDAGPKATLQLATSIWYNCGLHVDKPGYFIAMVPAQLPGWYVSAEPIYWLINAPIHVACGRWFHFKAFWRRIEPGQPWRWTDCTVRVFAVEDPEGN